MKAIFGSSSILGALLLCGLHVGCGGQATRANASGSGGGTAGATGSSSATTSGGLGGSQGAGAGGSAAGGAGVGAGAGGGEDGGVSEGGVGDSGVGDGGHGPVYAFPEAVGFGRNATGGRGGTVYLVTNLNDSGAGSFRDAVSAEHRIVVFTVGGYIQLESALSVSSNLTIAGQTGTGDGIGFMGREVSLSGSTNVIVRYLRFRQGTLDPDAGKSGVNLGDASLMIFDHVSIEFGQWDNFDAVGATNVTIQSSIIANPIGQQFDAHTETGPYTWYNDIFANAHNRNPLAKANTQFVNNVLYDFQGGYTAGNSAGVFTHDIIDNYFISGPATTNAGDAYFQMNGQKVYVHGNYLDSDKNGALNGAASGQPGGTTALTAPWSPLTATLATTSAAAAYAHDIADSGASLPHRDQVDALVIANVTSLGTSGKLWTTQTATGLANSGYGTLTGGVAPVDSDGDGMPDAWEIKYGLDPHDASDADGDFDDTGYTNIEKYINGIADGSYPI
jgi:hypothetical protein